MKHTSHHTVANIFTGLLVIGIPDLSLNNGDPCPDPDCAGTLFATAPDADSPRGVVRCTDCIFTAC